MISHGDALRRNFRLRISGLEAGLLSGQDSGQPVSEILRGTAELRGDQLHVPPPALGLHAGELGGADARRVRLRGEGEHAHHAHPAVEERGRCHRALSENDRPAAHCAAPGADPVPVAAGDEVRRRAFAQLPGTAARRPAVCLRVSPRELAGGGSVRRAAASATCRSAWRNRRGSKCRR